MTVLLSICSTFIFAVHVRFLFIYFSFFFPLPSFFSFFLFFLHVRFLIITGLLSMGSKSWTWLKWLSSNIKLEISLLLWRALSALWIQEHCIHQTDNLLLLSKKNMQIIIYTIYKIFRVTHWSLIGTLASWTCIYNSQRCWQFCRS